MPRADREFLHKIKLQGTTVVAQMESDVAMAAEADVGIITMLCTAWQQGYQTRRAQEAECHRDY